MDCDHIQRPRVPGSRAILGHGTMALVTVRRGCKESLVHERVLIITTSGTMDARLDDRLSELEADVNCINCRILGLSEHQRQGDNHIALYSGHLFYFRQGDQSSQSNV